MTEPLILYLRPFDSDGQIQVANPWAWTRFLTPFSAQEAPSLVPLEEVLLEMTPREKVLIAIGAKTEVIGPGKVLSTYDWWDYFEKLAHHAECLVSVPSTHVSTFQELEWIAKAGLRHKLLMILTPLHFSEATSPYGIRELRHQLSAAGISLPEDATDSSLVSFRPDGSPAEHVRDSKHRLRPLRRVIHRVTCGLHLV